MRSETVTTVVPAPQTAVFEYMPDVEKLPEWATEFARELKRDGEDYKVVNGQQHPRYGLLVRREAVDVPSVTGPLVAGARGVLLRDQGRPADRRDRHVRRALQGPIGDFPHPSSGAARRQHRLQLHDVPRTRHVRRAVRVPAPVAQARVHQHRGRVRMMGISAGEREKMLAGRVCG
jgi:hypothetical protein